MAKVYKVREYYVTDGRIVNKVIYLVLCFFLGSFGIHKFYAGKTGMGILYLLFFWTGIPFILSFIDFIIALFKHSNNGDILL